MSVSTSVGENMVFSARSLILEAERSLSSLGTTPVLVAVLSFIEREGGSVDSMSRVAETLDISYPGMTNITDRLEEKGLVARVQSDDRRAYRVSITLRGRTVLQESRDALDELVNANGGG